jgi:protein-arginine kinase activator protein McsA
MNQELEKLIDLTLVDGLLSEKERLVIYNKAKQLGVDEIEVDVILEGKLQQIQAKHPKSLKEKVGNIKTCPSCGASVKPFIDGCNDCGHVFRHDSLNKLTSELKDSKSD